MNKRKGKVPHFLIVDNPDFEYVACLHSPDYKGQGTHKFLIDVFGLKDIDEFKGNEKIYDILNHEPFSYRRMLESVRAREKLVQNVYEIKKKTFDIVIKKTLVNMDMCSVKCSNIDEFFHVIDWE